MKKVLLLTITLSCFTACSLFNTEQMFDIHKDSNDQIVLSDTQKNWKSFKETVDFRIQNELEGKRPEAGKKTWPEFWHWVIESQKSGRENPEKYINYIIKARGVNDLPNL